MIGWTMQQLECALRELPLCFKIYSQSFMVQRAKKGHSTGSSGQHAAI